MSLARALALCAALAAARAAADEPAPMDAAGHAADLSFPPSPDGAGPGELRLQLGLVAPGATRLRLLAPLLRADEDVRGVQLSPLGGSARGGVVGVQLSALVSWTGGAVRGAQGAALVSWAGSVTGAQVGLASVVGELRGAQLGLVNVGGDVHGAQVGLVNVARRAHGAQVGLVNVADEMEGLPVGLVPIVRDGEHRLLVLAGEDGLVSTAVVLGSRRWHSILSAAVQPVAGSARVWGGFGMGAHLGGPRAFVDVEGLGQAVVDRDDHLLLTLRALGGWQLRSRLALVAGPTVSCFWSKGFDPGIGAGPGLAWSTASGVARAWVGLQVGLRI